MRKTYATDGLVELVEALERADQKGYLPDAMRDAWDAFAYSDGVQTAPPTGDVEKLRGAAWKDYQMRSLGPLATTNEVALAHHAWDSAVSAALATLQGKPE